MKEGEKKTSQIKNKRIEKIGRKTEKKLNCENLCKLIVTFSLYKS